MENITSTTELIEAIQILEAEQADQLQQVRDKFYYTRQSLRPVNIIGSSLKEMVSSPNLFKNILGTAFALFAGYISSKAIFIGASNSKSRRIFGTVLKLGVASVVTRGPKIINSLKQLIFQRLSRKGNQNFIRS